MSVETYDCDCCGNNGVYSEYIDYCESCGKRICYWCLLDKHDGDKETYTYPYRNQETEDGIYEKHCPFCSGDKISDRQRVEFLMKIVNIGEAKLTLEDIDKDILYGRKNK